MEELAERVYRNALAWFDPTARLCRVCQRRLDVVVVESSESYGDMLPPVLVKARCPNGCLGTRH